MENKYGTLLNSNIKLHRDYFNEMCSLIGIQVIYRAPREGKHYTTYGELDSNFYEPLTVGCIFVEHPDQQTLKKIGWVSELQDTSSLINVPYDLPRLQQGALFIIPSGIDNAKGRVFRVVKLTNSIVYPSSITCEIIPEFEDSYEPRPQEYKHSSFNLLKGEDDEI